jgi:hypothetical protein
MTTELGLMVTHNGRSMSRPDGKREPFNPIGEKDQAGKAD